MRFASEAAPGRVSDDLFLDTDKLVAVFDGVTAPLGVETGCSHGPAWYVRRLARRLLATQPTARTLAESLEKAIEEVMGAHSECDLANPSTPAASLCLLRTEGDQLEYLVLSDVILLIETTAGLQVITDDRVHRALADLPTEPLPREQGKRKLTNRPDGYWIAAATPQAARHALCGRVPLSEVRRVVLLTDGASRAVDVFGVLDWQGLVELVAEAGPPELIRRVREAETQAPEGLLRKRHDDATVALWVLEEA